MQKNKNNYKIEPSHKLCKSDQMSCNEFIEYLSKYFKKISDDTFDILNPSSYLEADKSDSDLLYYLFIHENEILDLENQNLEESQIEQDKENFNLNITKLIKKQIQINNKRKSEIFKIIKKKIKYALVFEMIRDIDTEIESIILKRKRGYKKKRKIEDYQILKDLLYKRKLLEDDFIIDNSSDEYEEEEDIDSSNCY